MMTDEVKSILARAAADPAIVEAILRSRLASFVQMVFGTLNPGAPYLANWHIDAICWHLEEVLAGRLRRLIITLPPRSLKSITASVAFPAFVHGHDPSKSIISVTYGQELSAKLHNDYRAILAAPWYRALFRETKIDRRKDSEHEVTLTGRGSRVATSIGGTLTGRGADFIIVDDPLKPADAMSEPKRQGVNDWFGNTLVSRLNDKRTGAIIIVTQRVHAHDLVGHLLGTAPDEWTVLNLPAIATSCERVRIASNRVYSRSPGDVLHPEREPRDVLDRTRRDIGADAFEAQYQQNPAPPGGAMFKRAWIKRYTVLPKIEEEDVIIQSWDTASKTGPANDWSVCTTWLVQQNHHYLVDLFRDKLDYPSLRAAAHELAEKYAPRMILVEDAGIGTELVSDLQKLGHDVLAVSSTTSKQARAAVHSAKFEGGRVLFPQHAHWLPELENELLSFPGARNDDQVDSIVQALAYEIEEPGGFMWFNFGKW